jgi:hypothetical protein
MFPILNVPVVIILGKAWPLLEVGIWARGRGRLVVGSVILLEVGSLFQSKIFVKIWLAFGTWE